MKKKDVKEPEKKVKEPVKKVVEREKEKEPVKKIVEEEKVKEVIVEKKVGFNFIEVVIIMIITLIVGGLVGAFIVSSAHKNDFPLLDSGESVPSELAEFIQVYNEIKENYYDEIDGKELMEAGIAGLIDYLGDPFSTYMNKEESDEFNQQVNGSYVGIGAEVTKLEDGTVQIVTLFDNGAASNAGLKVKDQIVAVEDQDVTGMELDEVSDLLQGVEGTSVNVTIIRDGETKVYSLVRRKVDIPSVTSDVIERDDHKIGMIVIDIFAENTYTQFEQELLRLQTKEIDSLIIDVRGNTGGHLSVVENIASLFVPKGEIIYQLETKGIKQPIFSTHVADFKLPVVVLMNRGSASASEILAAALKESYGATLVGETTYGKGTVQTTRILSSGAQIKYTIQKWLTPNGNWINGEGIKPDIEVSLTNEDIINGKDTQLEKAIEVLTEK